MKHLLPKIGSTTNPLHKKAPIQKDGRFKKLASSN